MRVYFLIGCCNITSLIVIGGLACLLFVIGQTAESARITIQWHNSAIDQTLWTAVAKLLLQTERESFQGGISQIKCCNLLVCLSLHMPGANQWGCTYSSSFLVFLSFYFFSALCPHSTSLACIFLHVGHLFFYVSKQANTRDLLWCLKWDTWHVYHHASTIHSHKRFTLMHGSAASIQDNTSSFITRQQMSCGSRRDGHLHANTAQMYTSVSGLH